MGEALNGGEAFIVPKLREARSLPMLQSQKPSHSEPAAVDPAVAPVALPTVADIVALVADDMRRGAEEYLDETVVPHGGE
jgi:hypothetical protein